MKGTARHNRLREERMGVYDAFKNLTPGALKKLANTRLGELVDREATRARRRLDELTQRFPSAGPRELAQRFVDEKKQIASVVGGITGVFGVATVPLDLVGMAYLELALLVEVSTCFKGDVKSEAGKQELVDLFGYANGFGPVQRASPKLLGSLAAMLLTRGGLAGLGRVMPLVAMPISAYLNNQHVQRVGDVAVRHFEGWQHAEKNFRQVR